MAAKHPLTAAWLSFATTCNEHALPLAACSNGHNMHAIPAFPLLYPFSGHEVRGCSDCVSPLHAATPCSCLRPITRRRAPEACLESEPLFFRLSHSSWVINARIRIVPLHRKFAASLVTRSDAALSFRCAASFLTMIQHIEGRYWVVIASCLRAIDLPCG